MAAATAPPAPRRKRSSMWSELLGESLHHVTESSLSASPPASSAAAAATAGPATDELRRRQGSGRLVTSEFALDGWHVAHRPTSLDVLSDDAGAGARVDGNLSNGGERVFASVQALPLDEQLRLVRRLEDAHARQEMDECPRAARARGISFSMRIVPAEPERLSHVQRHLGELFLGQQLFNTLARRGLKHFWWLMPAPFLAGVAHVLTGPLEVGNPRGERGYARLLQGLAHLPLNAVIWGCADVEILRKLRTKAVAWWMLLNTLAFYACECALVRWEPLHTAGTALVGASILMLGFFDAFAWHRVPSWRSTRKFAYAACAALLAARLVRVLRTKQQQQPTADGSGGGGGGVAAAYNPVLYSSGLVSFTVAELYIQSGWNLVTFTLCMLWHAFRFPNSYVLWKSRLDCISLVDGATHHAQSSTPAGVGRILGSDEAAGVGRRAARGGDPPTPPAHQAVSATNVLPRTSSGGMVGRNPLHLSSKFSAPTTAQQAAAPPKGMVC